MYCILVCEGMKKLYIIFWGNVFVMDYSVWSFFLVDILIFVIVFVVDLVDVILVCCFDIVGDSVNYFIFECEEYV